MSRAAAARVRSHSSRSQRRVSSETCSLRLRPVWILSASAPTRSFSLRMTSVWTSSSVGAVEERRSCGFGADRVEGVDDVGAFLGGQDAGALERAREGLRAAHVARRAAASKCSDRRSARRLPTVRFRNGRPRVSSDCVSSVVMPSSISSSAFCACSRFSAWSNTTERARFDHAVGHFFAALGRQAVHEDGVGRGVREELVVDLVIGERGAALGGFLFLRPCWPTRRCRRRARPRRLRRDRA